jgi:hypothetical protein
MTLSLSYANTILDAAVSSTDDQSYYSIVDD